MEQTASWLQRVGALLVDWIASTLVVMLLIGAGGWSENQFAGLYTMGVFILESTVLTALVGGSFGKLALRLRVVRFDRSGRPVSLLMALVRSVMVCLVIPPLVFRPDGRGLHDMVAGTSTVLLRDVINGVGSRG
ncbi:RDD family protein [Nocardioides sp. JQ2195]|uniref:RDD family protein n=1 Tax=Nocardioides sp. JQ2195 TaxID=2592334 RepID=UPI001F0D609E|nr:RDD family protein [Nocardioides sp. JQ2195]